MGKAGFMARESGFMMMDAETSNGYGSDRGVGGLGVQPFAATPTTTCASYRSPVGMAGACLRYPFTAAQWQELERQALIFKYLKASVPVPNDLLIPITTNPLSHSNSSLRFANGSDPEPGRCRRTDGKKWRCSRDVAPDQKYCERHVQRNRPRSRKHVEVLSDVNNANATSPSLPPPPSLSAAAKRGGSIRPYPPPSPLFLSKPDFKSLPMETLGAALPYKDSRFINWMHKGDTSPMWSQSSNLHMDFAPPGFEGLGSHNQTDECALYLNPDLEHSDQRQMPGNFIDAWSTARPNSPKGTNKSSGDCKEKLSPSTLSLSMSSENGVGEDMDQIHMGLGVNDSECDNTDGSKPQLFNWMTPASWMGSTPGGPLGEVLRSGNAVSQAGSKPVSPRNANKSSGSGGGAINLMTDDWGGNSRHASPQGGWTATSSPSGVLHRILTSPSDSSGGNSPIYRTTAGNEVLQWMNQNM